MKFNFTQWTHSIHRSPFNLASIFSIEKNRYENRVKHNGLMLKHIVYKKIWSLSLIVLDIKGFLQLAQGAVPVSSIILQ